MLSLCGTESSHSWGGGHELGNSGAAAHYALDCCGKSASPLVHMLIAESMHDLLESEVPGHDSVGNLIKKPWAYNPKIGGVIQGALMKAQGFLIRFLHYVGDEMSPKRV